MVPGITDTECRMAEFRFRELLAEADRQRRAASAADAPENRVHVRETIHRHLAAVMEPFSHLLQGVRTRGAADPAAAPGTLSVQ